VTDKELIRLEANMMDQIMLVSGTGPVETWEVLRVWHTSQREEAEQYLADLVRKIDRA
jgi:hypothetical protein|tara:strand:+ start:3427 stop:3600 length:174 start_codon:yes stop_codon:yes gene_type:complete